MGTVWLPKVFFVAPKEGTSKGDDRMLLQGYKCINTYVPIYHCTRWPKQYHSLSQLEMSLVETKEHCRKSFIPFITQLAEEHTQNTKAWIVVW